VTTDETFDHWRLQFCLELRDGRPQCLRLVICHCNESIAANKCLGMAQDPVSKGPTTCSCGRSPDVFRRADEDWMESKLLEVESRSPVRSPWE
jgi:hypothetical protein